MINGTIFYFYHHIFDIKTKEPHFSMRLLSINLSNAAMGVYIDLKFKSQPCKIECAAKTHLNGIPITAGFGESGVMLIGINIE